MKNNKHVYKSFIQHQTALECLQKAKLIRSFKLSTHNQEGDICTNSHLVTFCDIFAAYNGTKHNSHTFIKEAILKGASFIILEDEHFVSSIPPNISWALTQNARKCVSFLEAEKQGNPQNQLDFIGITGTNGKTSTAWIAHELLKYFGIKSVYIGTLGCSLYEENSHTQHTTPDAKNLFSMLKDALKTKHSIVIMEVSSHALEQSRLGPITFSSAAFTSFSQDHLDYHKTMKDYWYSKQRLFTKHCKDKSDIFLHSSIKAHEESYGKIKAQSYYYGIKKAKTTNDNLDYRMNLLSADHKGSSLSYLKDGEKISFHLPYVGDFNLENFLAAFLLTKKHYYSLLEKENTLSTLKQIPGRFEALPKKLETNPQVFVDYAHTPDALEKTLALLKAYNAKNLFVVFGCGGSRDKNKRPLMGEVASKYADEIIITSDNPRDERAEDIAEQIRKGIKNQKNYKLLLDRETAISVAIKKASSKDCILIAGKGHERYQDINGERKPFCDVAIAKKYLALK